MPVSADEFRASMGCRATAVSIVTSRDGDEIHGMTVSDFTSVSLDPPLVVVCAAKDARTLEFIERGRCFAINILSEEQQGLSNLFASKENDGVRFEGLETDSGKTGAPLIQDALVSIDCTLTAQHDAGDHVLCVGQVEEVRIGEGAPMIYFQGKYRELA